MHWTNLLFYGVFLSQIFLISFYFPKRILRRGERVIENYPPQRYPKLYPRSIENYESEERVFRALTRCTFGLGFLVLFAVFYFEQSNVSADLYISKSWPAIYGIIQFIPLVYLEFTSHRQLKLMRATNRSAVRRANLRRRTLHGAVSPALVAMTLALLLAAGLLEFHASDLAGGSRSVDRSFWLVIVNLFLAATGARVLHGRRQNPHQATADRDHQVRIQISTMLYASMALSVFYMTLALSELLRVNYLDATLVSAYLQVVVLLSIGYSLRRFRLEAIDFDVYKSDESPG